jgi:hypothetical protein
VCGGRAQFVARHAANGTLRWARQFGCEAARSASADRSAPTVNDARSTPAEDAALGVHATDAVVVVVGATRGDLGGANAGGQDVFVAAFDPTTGDPLWTLQIGTAEDDVATAVSSDATAGCERPRHAPRLPRPARNAHPARRAASSSAATHRVRSLTRSARASAAVAAEPC